ncbi:hypothetical protein E8E12_010029 [Didymella heteroderae]|uniref:Diphthine--ammonia ligase n=1 Tax=Didymella heteroderae TaxID=1769908 RepID=A0A9P4WY40_9PLEO|nr:hypothetical protein E8E12_010029 [Didymella heteroderae]
MALNVIALVSGGKDSFFSILHCIANGHNVVALANLHPSATAPDNEDINSYMYQTVGHSVIPLYEQALGIALYRQEITGKAVNAARDYSTPQSQSQEKDETEDLIPLLRKAMQAHPEANAVSTGAILSTYQRTRVESVALRLGLTPLSFLWQYPLLPPYSQSQLLRDMAAVGQEAIVIKTASGGLDERILGWNVAAQSTITKLQKAMARFGEESNGAVLGEGGEFETLALDGPRPLWKKKIRIEPGAAGVSEGGQSVLKMRASELEEKSGDDEGWEGKLRIPEMFDDEFKRVLNEQETSNDTRSFISDDATLLNEPVVATSTFEDLPRNASTDTPTVFTYSNLSDTSRSSIPSSPSPSRQLTKILLRLDHVLKQWNLSRASINHCTLLLRSMSDFTVLNPIYGQYFSGVNPPARVTISVGDCMPSGIDVMLSIAIDKSAYTAKGKLVRSVNRQGLHVQGRSYWAPANIGPYSQAVSVKLPSDSRASEDNTGGEVVYVAGQIPLVPASMEVFTARGFRGQATLSLQHLWRIGRAKSVRWWTGAVGFIPAGEHAEEKVRIAQACWCSVHTPASALSGDGEVVEDDDDDDDVDPWDRRNTHVSSFNDATYRAPLPDPSIFPPSPSGERTEPSIPPCFIAQVDALPRAVDIEWSATGLTSSSLSFSRSPLTPLSITSPSHSSSRFYTLEIRSPDDTDALRHLGQESVKDWTSATLYASPTFDYEAYGKFSLRGVQWVPCRRVWGEGGREVAAVLVGRRDGSAGEGMGGVESLMKGLRFAGKEVREALEMS